LVARGVTTVSEAMAAVSGISDEVEIALSPPEPGEQLAPERVLSLLS